MEFKEYLKERRMQECMSLEQFAKKLGFSFTGYYFLESGKSKPTYQTINKLAQALEVEPSYLLKMVNNENNEQL